MARRPAAAKKAALRPPAPPLPQRLHAIHWMDLVIAAAITALAATLYILTVARDIVLGDTPELMLAAVILGVPHPPGYPLFTIVGHLFSLLPIGSVAFRLNLFAAACGTGTVSLVFFTALRLTGQRIASACAALVLAVTPLVWRWSLVAEVFALNNLLAALVIYLLVLWHTEPQRTGLLVAAAFVFGLALTNHQTVVTLAPAILYLLWRRRETLLAQPRGAGLGVAALLVGLLPYAYLPWAASRNPIWNWGDPSSWTNFVAVITRRHFGSGQLINTPKYIGGSAMGRLEVLAASFGFLAGPLLLFGAVQAYRRARWYLWFTLLGFVFAGPVFAAYANINIDVPLTKFVLERFFLLPEVLVAPLVAFSIATLKPRLMAAAGVAILVAALANVVYYYRTIDQSTNHAAHRFAQDLLDSLDHNAILLADGDEVISPVAYAQNIEGFRKDVTLVAMPLLHTDWYVEGLRRHYPNLAIPFPHYGGQSGTLRAFFDANRGRPIAVAGITPDDSVKNTYWTYRHGLVENVAPMTVDVTLTELLNQNERLFSQYRPPSQREVRQNTLDKAIPDQYVTPAFMMGQQCEQGHDYETARKWYQRALNLNPSLSQVREALNRVAVR